MNERKSAINSKGPRRRSKKEAWQTDRKKRPANLRAQQRGMKKKIGIETYRRRRRYGSSAAEPMNLAGGAVQRKSKENG